MPTQLQKMHFAQIGNYLAKLAKFLVFQKPFEKLMCPAFLSWKVGNPNRERLENVIENDGGHVELHN